MNGREWGSRYADALMNTFGAPQLVLVEGSGARVTDADGREYLDLLGGIAVNLLGQAHPAVVRAVSDQAGRLGHVSNFFATPPQVALGEHLLRIVEPGGAPGGSRVFLTNSGTESNECALKMVRAHANALTAGDGRPRPRILALEHAFHGRSTGALALTWKQAYRAPFEPLMPGVEFIPVGDIAALEQAMGEDVAGVFVEPVQGEAGVHEVDDDFLLAARRLTRQAGALLVCDEVQCGLGRTGDWMAHHRSGIVPDAVTLAKGLGGGMPIGACIGIGAAGSILGPGMHGTTFGGNPVCAAAANAVLDTVESEGLLDHAERLGRQWRAELRDLDLPGLTEVRGRGLLIGVEFSAPIAPLLVSAGREAGFILNAATPTTLRLAPPLVLTATQARSFTEALPGLVASAQRQEGHR
ncbi:acetylornithine transaminase [Schaalia naturae]|uniref:Acetylornithine transaminase n=1 Tax=Schaalia naturae TaxID=635203 RepID=A0ABW2SKA2_9ACTO